MVGTNCTNQIIRCAGGAGAYGLNLSGRYTCFTHIRCCGRESACTKEISMQSSIGTRRDYFLSYLCYMRRYNALYAGYPNKSVCRAVTVRTTTKRLCRYPDCC